MFTLLIAASLSVQPTISQDYGRFFESSFALKSEEIEVPKVFWTKISR